MGNGQSLHLADPSLLKKQFFSGNAYDTSLFTEINLLYPEEIFMTQTFGDFVAPSRERQEYLKIGFSPSSISLQSRWRNNGLSADFLADYLSTFFPGEDSAALDRRAEIKDAVAYVANELLENAMKFSYEPARQAVSITMQLESDRVRFYVSNSIDPTTLDKFHCFLQRLLSEDPNELYLERLLANAENGTEGGSGLGFLTMINNYRASLAWQFESPEENPDLVTVTTLVQLPV
jgi:hypothetical protein